MKSDEHWMGSAESLELLELELGGEAGGGGVGGWSRTEKEGVGFSAAE